MKERIDELTPSEMQGIDNNRLSEEEAHDLANLIMTKFDGLDLTKLEPKDYEQAQKEILELRKWANKDDTPVDDLKVILGQMTITLPLYFATIMGTTAIMNGIPYGSDLAVAAILSTMNGLAITAGKSRKSQKKLSDLYQKTSERRAAEKKYGKKVIK